MIHRHRNESTPPEIGRGLRTNKSKHLNQSLLEFYDDLDREVIGEVRMDKGLISDVASKYGVSMEILDRGEIRPEYVEGKKTVIHLVKEGYQ